MFRATALPVRRMIAVSAVLLVAAGCGSDGSSADAPAATAAASPAPIDSVAAADPTTPVATEAPSTEPAATEASTAEPTADTTADTMTVDMGDPAACLTGRWSLGPEQVQRTFDGTSFGSIPGASAVVAGEGFLELAGDGTYTYTPNFTISLTLADQTSEGEWSGVQTGTWGVEGSTLTMATISDGITGSLTFLGQTMPLPETVAFSGAAELVSCSPMTFETSVDSPIGPISNVFVLAD